MFLRLNNSDISWAFFVTRYFFNSSIIAMFLSYFLILNKYKYCKLTFYIPLLYAITLNIVYYSIIPERFFSFSENQFDLILLRPSAIDLIFSYINIVLENLLMTRNLSLIAFILAIISYFAAAASMYRLTKLTNWVQLNFLLTSAIAVGYLFLAPVLIKHVLIPYAHVTRGTANSAIYLAIGLLLFSLIMNLLTVKMEKPK
ncbi:MAG: hypothetical protein JXR63_12140 [Spirochaetales bacterium]|nr:hypothetical protein [Spirochaetales bacterium]